jgi:hypothetical protein
MRTRILTILGLRPEGVPETALRLELEMRFRVRVGELEFEEALRGLAALGRIASETDDVTGDRIWRVKGE